MVIRRRVIDTMKKYNYVFGVVASRRLGLSLGIDLVPKKYCSLDCVYCEAGATTNLSLERRAFVKAEDVIAELKEVFADDSVKFDYITFSGAGEPTLNSEIGKIVRFIKDEYPQFKLCLLTNALGFGDKELLDEIRDVDLCIPSLDASNDEEFQKINRPVSTLKFDDFVKNLISYTQIASARIILELFIVPTINDSDESIERFCQIIKQMKVEKVQLNSLDRPGTCDWVKPSNKENTMRFIEALEKFVPVEAVGPFKYKSVSLCSSIEMTNLQQNIINLIRRRPATMADLILATNCDAKMLNSALQGLLQAGLVNSERCERGEFYSANVKVEKPIS